MGGTSGVSGGASQAGSGFFAPSQSGGYTDVASTPQNVPQPGPGYDQAPVEQAPLGGYITSPGGIITNAGPQPAPFAGIPHYNTIQQYIPHTSTAGTVWNDQWGQMGTPNIAENYWNDPGLAAFQAQQANSGDTTDAQRQAYYDANPRTQPAWDPTTLPNWAAAHPANDGTYYGTAKPPPDVYNATNPLAQARGGGVFRRGIGGALGRIGHGLRLGQGAFLKIPKGVLKEPQKMRFKHLQNGGYINSAVPGRTDKHYVTVDSGAYVLPADHVSALGQNNSNAGAQVIKDMFAPGTKYGPRLAIPRFAGGGAVEKVPIVVAGGEIVVPPNIVRRIGNGDVAKGHAALDKWVLETRKKHISKLESLKPPKGAGEK